MREPAASALPTRPGAHSTPSIPQPPPSGAEWEFPRTDFRRSLVSFDEILPGGPPRDGIPAIDHPRFVSTSEADLWLKPNEPVILVRLNGEARAYPLQVLIWHEIVNDIIGGTPVLVTFCPLCNTAIAFQRTLGGRVLEFGTTGRLRYSNLIMYDRQTETWWQQATGEAIIGELAGARLEPIPAAIIAWADFRQAYPTGKVLSRETGHMRPYGRNPYVGYDDVRNPPFLYHGPQPDGRLPPMARILGVEINNDPVAYPYDVLKERRVMNAIVGGTPIVVIWKPGTASPVDAPEVHAGRDVGAAVAFDRRSGGLMLTFRWEGDHLIDEQTGSVWDMTGRAVAGPMARENRSLTPVIAVDSFWFSWSVFKPATRIALP